MSGVRLSRGTFLFSTAKKKRRSDAQHVLQGLQPRVCGMCDGTGTYSQRSSMLTISTLCGSCSGSGRKIDILCSYCNEGRISRKKRLAVDVPAGVVRGMKKVRKAFLVCIL